MKGKINDSEEWERWLKGFIQLTVPAAILKICCFLAARHPHPSIFDPFLLKSNCYDDAISQHIMKILHMVSSILPRQP